MEEKGVSNSGAPESYRVAPRIESISTNNEFSGSVVAATVATPVSTTTTTTTTQLNPTSGRVVCMQTLPLPGGVSKTSECNSYFNRRKGEELGSMDQMVKWSPWHCHQCQYQLQFPFMENLHLGKTVEVAPLIILRRTSLRSKLQDVSMKIISFAQQESRVTCVLAASGAVSSVTLHQTTSGGTLTYEGHFHILSLEGSFMPSDGVTKSRSGGLGVVLSDLDGQVIGGTLTGLLVAASLVQVIIGSFPAGHQLEQNREEQWIEHAAPFAAIPAPPISEERANGADSVAASISFPGSNSMSGMPGEESNQQSPSS